MNRSSASLFARAKRDISINRYVYLMMIPVLVYYLVFHYAPMYGAMIAFKDYSPGLGIWGSPWVGLKHIKEFVSGYYFLRLMRNTLLISLYQLLFSFPIPILMALLLNEIQSSKFKRTVQTVTYMPHFISMVVICGMIRDFVARDGLITELLVTLFQFERTNLLNVAGMFRGIYVISGIWQTTGWGTIVYLSALSGVDQEQYEAARIDGAGRLKQMIHITLPGIMPTIVIMFILRVGQIMNVGFEKIILLYNPGIYETADVISSYVYRIGLVEGFRYSYTTAIGLFQSVINFVLVVLANSVSRRLNETSLW